MDDGETLDNSSSCFISLAIFVQEQPRSDAAGVALGEKIYVVGGFDGANLLRSVERFKPNHNNLSFVFYKNELSQEIGNTAVHCCLSWSLVNPGAGLPEEPKGHPGQDC